MQISAGEEDDELTFWINDQFPRSLFLSVHICWVFVIFSGFVLNTLSVPAFEYEMLSRFCKHMSNMHYLPVAGEIRLAFVLYNNLGSYLSTENASFKLGSEAMSTNHTVIVNSQVVSASINKESNRIYLAAPVIFTLKHIDVSAEMKFLRLCVCVCGCECLCVFFCHLLCAKPWPAE